MGRNNSAMQGLVSEDAYWRLHVTGTEAKLIWAVIKHEKVLHPV